MTLLKNAIAASLLSSKPNGLADVGPGLGSIAEPTPGQDHPAFSNPKRGYVQAGATIRHGRNPVGVGIYETEKPGVASVSLRQPGAEIRIPVGDGCGL